MLSIGWVVLSEQAGSEIVFGAVTQPWLAAPTFRSAPGVKLIRVAMLQPLRRAAEQRARAEAAI